MLLADPKDIKTKDQCRKY